MPGYPVAEVFDHLDRNYMAITNDEFTITNETRSNLEWRYVDISGRLSRRIIAPNPIMTSPMTTVTEHAMAIAAAEMGGVGVIHCANTPEEQKREIRSVKYHLNGVIDEPIDASPAQTIRELQLKLDKDSRDFKTVPVVDGDHRFVGLMTNTIFQLFGEQEGDRPIGEVMIPAEQVTTGLSAWRDNPHLAYEKMKEHKIKLLPLLTVSGELDGMFMLKDLKRVIFGNPAGYNLDEHGRLITAMAVSTWAEDALERVRLSGKYADLIVIDTSHGEHEHTFDAMKTLKEACKLVKNLREEFDAIDIMAGNVSDIESGLALAHEGADAIRVGRGPGEICISREKLGGGTPQATAVYEVAKAVHEYDPTIAVCADGGNRGPGDYAKARLLGADCIMVGGYVAGTDEAAAPEMVRPDGTRYKEYNGMGSSKELKHSWAARLRYDPEFKEPTLDDDDIFVEGIEKELSPRGPVKKRLRDMSRGLKVEMTNGGFADVSELQAGGRIRLVSAAGRAEGGARL
jgi:IMP dehydrogenase